MCALFSRHVWKILNVFGQKRSGQNSSCNHFGHQIYRHRLYFGRDVQVFLMINDICLETLHKQDKTLASLGVAWCTWVNSPKSIWILRKKYLLSSWDASPVWKMIMTTTASSGWGLINRIFNVLNIEYWKGFHFVPNALKVF